MHIVALRNYFIKPLLLYTILNLIPCLGFSWGEGRNPIEYVGIYSIYLDSNYVFCGTNSDWGANRYGLFVFDRKTECWHNYSKANTGIPNDIMVIQKVDSFVDVLAGIGTLRFNLPSLDYMVIDSMVGHRNLRSGFFRDSLAFGNRVYKTALDSVSITERDNRVAILIFEQPLDYDAYGTGEIVTDCFLYDSSIILTTAIRGYEANVAPASGFLELFPQDLSVKPWTKIKLSEKALAILCVEQDEKELWIGTNRGVYCIEKKNMRKIHYNITKGIVVAEELDVHCSRWGRSPTIYECQKGDMLELLGEQEHMMEIALPKEYSGYLNKDYVKEEIDDLIRGRVVRIKDLDDLKDGNYTITIKASNNWNSVTIAEFPHGLLPSKEFTYSSKIGDWYLVTVSKTGWVPMKDLIFHLDKVAY